MARRFLREDFGQEWWLESAAWETVQGMASPAALYDLFLASMNGWYDSDFTPHFKMHAIAHLSGGGIRTKFAEDILFRQGLSAKLTNLWMPPKFMSGCVRRFSMSDEEAYTVFNGGQGVLVVVDSDQADRFCERARQCNIEARVAGFIDKRYREPRVKIDSKFSFRSFMMR
jgi:phosphoribosylaminoimidazole (AIR) synthetase